MSDKFRVLLVEDDEVELKALSDIIQKKAPILKELIESLDIRLVDRNGAGGVAKEIAENPSRWNIIISDLFMPTPALGGLLIARTLQPFFEKDQDFPLKLILITREGSRGSDELAEFIPACNAWLSATAKPIITTLDVLRSDLYLETTWAYIIQKEMQRIKSGTAEDSSSSIFSGLPGKMQVVQTELDETAQSNETVLLFAESGVGKSIYEKYIVKKYFEGKGEKYRGPVVRFVGSTVNQIQLFGAVSGMRGPKSKKIVGDFEKGLNGIVIIDEFADLSRKAQDLLVDVLNPDIRTFTPMGSNDAINFNGKIICETSINLEGNDKFRDDIYNRIPRRITIPPLRERREDIIPIANQLIVAVCKKEGIPIKTLTNEARQMLKDYDWREGNTRELKIRITDAVKKSQRVKRNEIIPTDFPLIKQVEALQELSEGPADIFVKIICTMQREEVTNSLNEVIVKTKIVEGIKILRQQCENIRALSTMLGFKINKYFYDWLGNWGLSIKDI